jgi:hypothetical protein
MGTTINRFFVRRPGRATRALAVGALAFALVGPASVSAATARMSFTFGLTNSRVFTALTESTPILATSTVKHTYLPGAMTQVEGRVSGAGGKAFIASAWDSSLMTSAYSRPTGSQITVGLSFATAKYEYSADIAGAADWQMCVGFQIIDAATNKVVAQPASYSFSWNLRVENIPCAVYRYDNHGQAWIVSGSKDVKGCWSGASIETCPFARNLLLNVLAPISVNGRYYVRIFDIGRTNDMAVSGTVTFLNRLEKPKVTISW